MFIRSLLALILAAILVFSTTTVTTVTGQQSQSNSSNNGIPVLSSSIVKTEYGSVYVVGEVRNDLPDVVKYVKVVGTFYDSSGALIDTDYSYTYLDELRPGERSPFKLIITDESVSSRINNYNLSVTEERAFSAKPAALRIEEGEKRTAEFGGYEVIGQVVNTGSEDTTYVKVSGTFYDENGKVVDTEFTYTDPSDLAAGQSAPFKLTVLSEDIADDIESVRLTAQSNDYFMIDPEVQQTEVAQPTPQQQPPQSPQETMATIFQSNIDGIRVGVPRGWIVEDTDNTDPLMQQREQSFGAGLLVSLCPQDQATPQIGGTYVCPSEVIDSVPIFRFADLKSRPEFIGVVERGQNITVSDLVAYYFQWAEVTLGFTNFRLLENIDRTVNLTDPQTNETIGTAPAKYIEVTFLDSEGRRNPRDAAFLVLSNDGNTGYALIPTTSVLRLEALPPEQQQVIDSFGLVVANSTTNATTIGATQQQQQIQQSSPLSRQLQS